MSKFKKLLCIMLVVVLTVPIITSGIVTLPVSAANINTITVDQPLDISWNENTEEVYAYLEVNETGYYNISAQNMVEYPNDDSNIFLSISNIDYNDTNWSNMYYESNYMEIGDYNEMSHVFLVEDQQYELTLSYGYYNDDYDFIPEDAAVKILVSSSDYSPVQLTLGEKENIYISNTVPEWIEFKTNEAGNYLFSLNESEEVAINIYEKMSGNRLSVLGFYDTTNGLISLKPNTEYIIKAYHYDVSSPKLMRLSVTKTAKEINKLDVVQDGVIIPDDYDFGSLIWWKVKYNNYKITYSDNSTEVLSYYDCIYEGIRIEDVIYSGDTYSYNGETFFCAGKQPVQVRYMCGESSNSYIQVTSFLDWCSDIDAVLVGEDMTVEYEDDEEHTLYWKIKPSTTNNYEFYSYDWDEIDCYITVFDKNNKVITRSNGWNLVGGQEYCLKLEYTYEDDCYENVEFQMEPNRDHNHNTTKKVTKATLATNGKIESKCTLCGNTTQETIYRPTSFTLSTTSYTYNGSAKKPTVTVKDVKGNKLISGTDYTVSYATGRTNPGKYKVTVTLKGNYSGTKSLYFTINPKAPSKLTVSSRSTSSIKLSWPKVTGATGYRIYRYDSSTGTYKTVATTTNLSYTVKNLKSATNYTYRIKSYKKLSDGTTIWSGYRALTTATKPVAPLINSLTSSSKGKVTLKWTNVARESGYQIYYSTSKTGTYKLLDTTKVNDVSETCGGLKSGRTYYFKVRAFKTVNGNKVYSSFSAVKGRKIK